MKRSLSLALVFTAWAGVASADAMVDRVTQQLAKQGYSEIVISRTWLGRIRIEAYGGTASREIILNPRTGEILRDYWEDEGDEAPDLLSARRSGAGAVEPSDEDDDGAPDEDDDDDGAEEDDGQEEDDDDTDDGDDGDDEGADEDDDTDDDDDDESGDDDDDEGDDDD